MHGHGNEAEFLANISGFLGFYYVALAALNGIAAFYLRSSGKVKPWFQVGRWTITNLTVLLGAIFLFLIFAPLAWSADPQIMALVSIPNVFRELADKLMGPMVYSVGSLFLLTFLFWGRRLFTRPEVAWTGLNLSLLFMGFSMTDADFAAIVTKPDNVPIVGLIFLLGFFTWLATRKAVINDRRIAAGDEPAEHADMEKVLVWPDLVYIELICMVA